VRSESAVHSSKTREQRRWRGERREVGVYKPLSRLPWLSPYSTHLVVLLPKSMHQSLMDCVCSSFRKFLRTEPWGEWFLCAPSTPKTIRQHEWSLPSSSSLYQKNYFKESHRVCLLLCLSLNYAHLYRIECLSLSCSSKSRHPQQISAPASS